MTDKRYSLLTITAFCLTLLQCQNWEKFWLAPSNLSFSPDWGGAGDVISITGSGFGHLASDLTVTFNGVPGTVQSANASEIQVLVPANATSGKIKVTGINGHSSVSEQDFRFNKYFLYTTTSTALYGYQFDQITGALNPLPGLPFATATATGSIVVAHEYKYLYATNYSANNVGKFSIDRQTGSVTDLGTTATSTNPEYLCTDSQSRYLYVSIGGASFISGFGIVEDTGALNALPGSPYAAASRTLGIAVTPGDAYVLTANELTDNVRSQSIAFNGSLTPSTTQAAGDAPRGLAIHPSLPYFYVTNTTSSNVYGYQYNRTTGTFSALAGFPVALGTYSPMIAFDKTGKHMYIASQNATIGMYGFNIDQGSGAISAIAGSPFAAANYESRGLAVDPYNRFIVSSRSTGSAITMFSRNSDGSITEVPNQTHTVGAIPQRFVFVSAKQ